MIAETIIESKSAFKYLELTTDLKMSFLNQIETAVDIAGVSALCRIIANFVSPTSSRKCLLMKGNALSNQVYVSEEPSDFCLPYRLRVSCYDAHGGNSKPSIRARKRIQEKWFLEKYGYI